jgi:hypothetical protein
MKKRESVEGVKRSEARQCVVRKSDVDQHRAARRIMTKLDEPSTSTNRWIASRYASSLSFESTQMQKKRPAYLLHTSSESEEGQTRSASSVPPYSDRGVRDVTCRRSCSFGTVSTGREVVSAPTRARRATENEPSVGRLASLTSTKLD